ncbi:D-glycerate dehydrogenase [uncultured Paracoccus sp.]|uniref:2-hydroxyacid dehydrogenase n=1 Tax=uncultured Paracoccus sp. TaxID=189685 RepID=UPI0025F45F08|nr:D-glycerate dehydrogenase [uncultured Paracoccus sp.]
MKLLVTRRMTQAAESLISARFDATFLPDSPGLSPADAARALMDYDLVMPTLGDGFDKAAFAQQGIRCKLLANFGAGFNHIDIEAARAAGVAVTNTPEVVTNSTADIAMTLLLMTARRAGEGERLVRAGKWEGWQPTQLLGTHVSGKTVGIIGMGRIGKAIARRCHFGFDMRVVFYNRSAVSALDFPAEQIPDLHDMLSQCNFAVVAVPGGAGTRHLIGATELERLGRAGHIVNIARGDVVDEAALIHALERGAIAGAGLDVYEREPVVPDALKALPNVTLLPHLGTATEESRTAMASRALDNLIAFAEGRNLPDRVA